MKNHILKLALVLTTFLTILSCSKDEVAPTEPALIGTWQYSKETNSTGAFVDYSHAAGCGKDKIVISATTIKSITFDSAPQGSTTCSESLITIPYTRNGKILTVQASTSTNNITIVNITDTELTLKSPDGSVIMTRS